MTSYARNHAPVNLASGPHIQYSDAQLAHAQRRQKFVADLSQCLLDFVVQLLPTMEELAVKEDVRKLLERLIRTIEPESRLLSFGSTANGFSLRNSDMDLCCLIDSEQRLPASDLVTMVGDLLERETKFHVKPLPHARIPIVKLSLDPSPGLPLGIACDIGFENRLALENTRLLLCYSMVDPTRVRSLVLFLKVWSKRRKINSPYEGTLSSYGYVLLVIYFLVHVKNPPVLPNLQQIPPLHSIPPEEHHMGNRNIWFFDDIELLRQRWKSQNTESVAELLIDFFRYYAKDFAYNSGVASIRAGLLKKESKGWQTDNDPRFKDGRERNRLCIEDPFEIDYNVARCVTRDGLYVIRGEFMRASRILQLRQERGYQALAQLCEERDDSLNKLNAAHNTLFVPPRLSFPPQTPYSVGSNSYRPHGTPVRDRLSPPRKKLGQSEPPAIPPHIRSTSPPEHMASKRSKFTSPPPPEAPERELESFESRLNYALSLATAATEAREKEKTYMSSSSNSEIMSDDSDARSDIAQEDDDVKSVQSFTGDPCVVRSKPNERQSTFSPSSVPHRMSAGHLAVAFQQANIRAQDDITPTPFTNPQYTRGRRAARAIHDQAFPPVSYHMHSNDSRRFNFGGKSESLRRSNSGPARANHSPRMHLATAQQMPFNVPLPPSPVHPSLSSSPTVYYETNAQHSRGSSFSPVHTAMPVNPLTLYQQQQYYVAQAHAQAQAQAQALGQSYQMSEGAVTSGNPSDMQQRQQQVSRPVHSHTHSSSTIVGPPSPAASSFALSQLHISSNNHSQQSSPSHSPSPSHIAFSHLPFIPAPQHSGVSHSSPQSSLSFRSSPSSQQGPGQRQSPSHLSSPHLSSHLPHLTRRQGQSQTLGHSFVPAQLHSQLRKPALSDSAKASFSLDLASPTDSPVSSGSSHAGSVSGSAGSPGSLSPISSTSPRTAEHSSPRVPSPVRRPRDIGQAGDQQSPLEQNVAYHSDVRKQQAPGHGPLHGRSPRQLIMQTRPRKVSVPMTNQEQSVSTTTNKSSLLQALSEAQSPQTRECIPGSNGDRDWSATSTADEMPRLKDSSSSQAYDTARKAEIATDLEPLPLDRIDECLEDGGSVCDHGDLGAAQDWEPVSYGLSQLRH